MPDDLKDNPKLRHPAILLGCMVRHPQATMDLAIIRVETDAKDQQFFTAKCGKVQIRDKAEAFTGWEDL